MDLDDYSPELINWMRDQIQHMWDMQWAMEYNERLIGVPYGPALCEVRREDGSRIDGTPEGGSRFPWEW